MKFVVGSSPQTSASIQTCRNLGLIKLYTFSLIFFPIKVNNCCLPIGVDYKKSRIKIRKLKTDWAMTGASEKTFIKRYKIQNIMKKHPNFLQEKAGKHRKKCIRSYSSWRRRYLQILMERLDIILSIFQYRFLPYFLL